VDGRAFLNISRFLRLLAGLREFETGDEENEGEEEEEEEEGEIGMDKDEGEDGHNSKHDRIPGSEFGDAKNNENINNQEASSKSLGSRKYRQVLGCFVASCCGGGDPGLTVLKPKDFLNIFGNI